MKALSAVGRSPGIRPGTACQERADFPRLRHPPSVPPRERGRGSTERYRGVERAEIDGIWFTNIKGGCPLAHLPRLPGPIPCVNGAGEKPSLNLQTSWPGEGALTEMQAEGCRCYSAIAAAAGEDERQPDEEEGGGRQGSGSVV